jgi:diguanylate cyclase (GGDEF)-like protein/PAS domain S-box-containing protein
MAVPRRQTALLDVMRALSSTLDLDEVGRRFGEQARELTGGTAGIWLRTSGREDSVTLLGTDEERPAGADTPFGHVLATCRPLRVQGHLLLPVACDGTALGLIEVRDAPAEDIASGGLQFWRGLGEVVGSAVANARRYERLSEAALRFQALVEQIPAMTYIDRAGTGEPIYTSPQLETLLGMSADEWLSDVDGWTARIHPDDREQAAAGYRRCVETGEPYSHSYRVVDMKGRVRSFQDDAVMVRAADGTPLEVHGVIYDITPRKTAETAARVSRQALVEAERRYRTLVEQLPLAIYIDALDEVGTSIYNSPQNEVITGHSQAEWQADPGLFEKIVHPDDRERVITGFADARRALAPFTSEYRVNRPGGSTVWVRDDSIVVPDADGRPAYRQGYLMDITQRKLAEERLAHLAYHDPLTGLPNRALFSEHLEVALARAERSGRGIAVLYVDLDDFKLVNDSFGHGAGDELLIEVARRLREAVRSTDVVARQGGDEFLILVADLDVGEAETPVGIADVAGHVAEQLRTALSTPCDISGTEIYCSGSVGISLHPLDAADAESLLKHADVAMYKAKERGRDGHEVYTRDGGDAIARLSMAGRLRRAIERDQLVLHYQPLLDLRTERVVGVEALIRWNDGPRGLVMPGEFIPLAERTGLIAPISDWVIETACRQGRVWRDAGLDLYVSVNLPPVFWEPTAMRQVLATIESFGLSPDRMMIEITESAVARDAVRNEPVLAELHQRGLRLAIDDFGTGHSSLGRLNQMSVTTLKIDRSFVADLPGDPSAAVLVATMIRLADGLGLQPLAEGIETEEQLQFLVEHGCPLGQGFLFSRPVPAEQVAPLLSRFPRAA